VSHQLTQVQCAGSVMGHFAVHIAGKHVVVAIAENAAEIRRRANGSDLYAADVNQMPQRRVRRQVEIEFAVSRRSKDVGYAFACQRPAFLLHQYFERVPGVVRIGGGRKADVAVLRHVPALGAVAAARRRRAFGEVEFFPIVAQLCQMRAVAIGRDGKIREWIGLRADLVRHFLKLDPIVAQQRFATHLHLQLMPGGEETFRRGALRKIAGEQRRVVVAQFLAEPAEPTRQKSGHDTERQDESDVAVAEAADGDDGAHALARSDMPLPRREPIKRLERGAVGEPFEAAPFGFDRVQIAVDPQIEARGTSRSASLRRATAVAPTSTDAVSFRNAVSVVARVTALTEEMSRYPFGDNRE
jgi:hypothetical protein